VIVHESDEAEHDSMIKKLPDRCKSHQIKLNADKCHINVSEIPFLGHIVTSEGLMPDPQKIQAVIKMKKPGDQERLRGTVTYFPRYVPKLTDEFRPISVFAQQVRVWMWGEAQGKAFTKLKQLLTQAPT